METNNTVVEKKEGIGSKILGTIVNVVLIIAIVVAFICTYTSFVTKSGSGVPSILGFEPFAIQSDSMSPFFEKGDLVIDKKISNIDDLKEEDVITFWTIIEGQRVLNTHRIVSIEDTGNFKYFVTKGDNNTVEDSLTVHQAEIVGKYLTHIKGLGKVLDFLQTSKGFFCAIVLPVFAFFIYYLVQMFRVLFQYQAEKNRLLYEKEQSQQGQIQLSEEQLRQLLAKVESEAAKTKQEEAATEEATQEETESEEKPETEPETETETENETEKEPAKEAEKEESTSEA